MRTLNEFVQAVKTECVMDSTKFSFFEIPDLIVRKKYSRESYENIKKLILKVKLNYLKIKQEAKQMENDKKEQVKGFSNVDDDTVSQRKSQSGKSGKSEKEY